MTILYRQTIKLTQGAIGMIANIQTYFYNKRSFKKDVNILYQDGLVSLNTNSKVLTIEDDVKDLYSLLYQDNEALKIIQNLGLQEGDVLLGRENIYIFISKATGKLAIKNNATDLKTILMQNIDIDKAFLSSLNSALGQPDYNSFKTTLQSTIAGYIDQKDAINTLIESLLKS